MFVSGDLHSGDCATPHGLHHLLHDVCLPLRVLCHLQRYSSVGQSIPCDLPGVPDVPINVLLGGAIDVEIMVNHCQAGPDSGLLGSEEGVLWQVHIVYLVELLILACVKVLRHVVEVLQAAVLIATERQHQLLVRQ